MRIAIVAPPWLPVPPVGYGGTELVIDGLCRGLSAIGHEVLLCTTGDSTCGVERYSTFDSSLGTRSMRAELELRHVIASYDAIADWRADVIHDHTVVGPVHSRIGTSPVVSTIHGPYAGDFQEVYRAIALRVPTIAVSHHQATTAWPAPVAAVIHHGIDVQQHPVGRGAGGYALFLGRMNKDKGVRAAITAARAAGVPLRIAGKMTEDNERAFFHEVVQPLLGGDVEFLGEVGGEDKRTLMADATCLLDPIAWPEPFGMVMVEALACGTPVVTTPAGAAPEIVDDGETGYLRRATPALATALVEAASLERRACRAAVQRRFSVERMVADHVHFYEDVVAACETPMSTMGWVAS